MRTKHNPGFWALVLAATFAILPATVIGQGTAFTYQGRLTDAGNPANGDYDLKFSLYDDAGAGNRVGDSITNAPVAVSNGLFTVTLDFGPAIFDGSPRWLEIGVATGGSADFTVLSPRQALTPTPCAIHADTASGTTPGAVVTSLNTLKDDVTIEAGANVTVTPNGNSLTIASAGAGGSGIWNLNGSNTYFDTGNVGIGNNVPQERLTISGVTAFNNGLKLTGNSTAGVGLAIENTTGGGHKYDLLSGGSGTGVGAGGFGIWDETAGSYRLAISSGGFVGLGTTTPASRLTVRTTGLFERYGIEHTDGTVRLSTFIDGTGGWLGTRTAHALKFYVGDGDSSLTVDLSGSTVATPNGGVGGYGSMTLGTPNGESGLTIKGYGGSPNRADLRFNGSSVKLVAGPGAGPPGLTSGIAVTTAGNVGIGTDAPVSKLDVRGTTRTCILTITGGCDLAEPFQLTEAQIEKGSVVVIDDENPGRLKMSTRPCDTRVAGIISGANGVNTGIALQQEGLFEDGQNVALTGRVYARADASFGEIKPGDLLTTSTTPGHAMKVGDHANAQGAILGKAMTGLRDGKGFVLVLVTLQ